MRVLIAAMAALAACVGAPEPSVDHASFEDVRRIVNALDDVAGDYPNAVASGAVVDPVRMRVLGRLLHDAERFAEHLRPTDLAAVRALAAAIARHDPADRVIAEARRLRRQLLDERRIVLAPAAPPPLPRVRALWAMMCSTCHGDTGIGDGPQGLYLEPPPKDFQELEFIVDLSPSRAYGRITDGMAGTAMPSFGIPNRAERWGLAALVLSFRHDEPAIARGRAIARATGVAPGWSSLADRTDAQLLGWLTQRGLSPLAAADVIAYLRADVAFAPVEGALAALRGELAAALDAYQAQRWRDARARVMAARGALARRRTAIAAADRTVAARLDEQVARLLAVIDRRELEEALAHEVVRTQALCDRAEGALAELHLTGGIGLALERTGLALLALGISLGLARRRRRAAVAAIVAAVVGAVLGVAGDGAWVVAAAVVALTVTLVTHRWALAAVALASVVGASDGAIAAALPASAATLAATAAIGAGIVAALAWATRRAPPGVGAVAVTAAMAVAAGQLAWRTWLVSDHPTRLQPWPRIEVLGVTPMAAGLVAGAAAIAVAVVAVVVRHRVIRPAA